MTDRPLPEGAALGQSGITDFTGFDLFDAPPGLDLVEFVSSEVTAVCPVTGQPDFYEVRVAYRPEGQCVESKTMKLYLQSFRDGGMFAEAFAHRIASDVAAAVKVHVHVRVTQVPRGGVELIVDATGEPA